jgi:hypothetical protein
MGFDINSAMVGTKTSVIKPTNLNENKGTDKLPSKGSETTWNKQFQPLVDELKLDKEINYSNSLHMMRAINGRYDKLLSSDVDPKVKDLVKNLKNSSWGAMNELGKLKTGGYDGDRASKLFMNAAKADSELAAALNYSKNKGFVYDPDTKAIYDRKTFEKKTDKPVIEKGGSTQTGAGEGGVNRYAGYNQLKNYSNLMTKELRAKINPLVSTWTTNATRLLNADDRSAGKFDPDNRTKTYALTVDILTHVQKYGTTTGNKNVDAQNKQKADQILKTLWKTKGFPNKMDVIKKFTNGEENVIADLSKNLGFYGSNYVYQRHKDKLGTNKKYFTGAEKMSDKLDDLDGLIDEFNNYKGSETKWRQSALQIAKTKDNSLQGTEAIYNNLLDKNGTIVDFDTWKQRLRTMKDPNAGKTMETGYGGMKTHGATMNVLKYVIEENMPSFNLLGENSDVAKDSWVPFYQEVDYNKMARRVYNDAVKNYKSKFSDLKFDKQIKGHARVVQFGNTADHNMSYRSIDMSLDKNGYLKNTEGKKAENANILFNIMRTPDGTIDTEKITLFNDTRTKQGMYKNATRDDLRLLQENNEKTFNDFFKGVKNDDVQITYVKNASLNYHGAYIFKNNETGKTMTMVAPNSVLQEAKEPMFINTFMSTAEYRFQQLGKRKLPDVDGLYKDALIYDENGIKTASWKFKNKDGQMEEYTLPIGDVDILTATKQFNDVMQDYTRLKNMSNGK